MDNQQETNINKTILILKINYLLVGSSETLRNTPYLNKDEDQVHFILKNIN